MRFRCLTNKSHMFDLDPPENAKTPWDWRGDGIKCPYDGSTDLEEHMMVSAGSSSVDLSKARRENAAATRMAQEMAGAAKQREAIENPDVVLAPIQGAGRFGGDAIKVKKNIIDSLNAKKPEGYD